MIRILTGAGLSLLALALLMAMTIEAIAPSLALAFTSYATLLAGMLLTAMGAAALPTRPIEKEERRGEMISPHPTLFGAGGEPRCRKSAQYHCNQRICTR